MTQLTNRNIQRKYITTLTQFRRLASVSRETFRRQTCRDAMFKFGVSVSVTRVHRRSTLRGGWLRCNSRFTFHSRILLQRSRAGELRWIRNPSRLRSPLRPADPNLCETLAGLRATMKYDAREDRRTAAHAESERSSAVMRVTRIA